MISGGNGGWNSSGVTSHYGNLPVRPYLLGSGTGSSSNMLMSNEEAPADHVSSHHPSPSTMGVPNSSSSGDQRIQSPPGHSGGTAGPPAHHPHHQPQHHSHYEDESPQPGSTHMNNSGATTTLIISLPTSPNICIYIFKQKKTIPLSLSLVSSARL